MPLKSVPFCRGSRFQFIPRDFIRDPLGFVVREVPWSGDLFKIRLLHRTIHITTNLEVIRHVLQVNHRNYRKGPLLQRFSFELVPGQQLVPQPLVTLKPRDGILMKVKNYSSSLKYTL